MQVSAQQLGWRLRRAREDRRITQNAASSAIGLQRSAISLMESGQRQVSTLELMRLAELYRRPVEWFVSPTASDEEEAVVTLFRAAPGLQSGQLKDEAVRCIRLFREGSSLASILGRESVSTLPRYEMPEPRTTGFSIAQGRRVANHERRRLGLGGAPVSSIPELVVSQGVWAAALELPDEISGLFLRSLEFGMGILVNLSQVPVRRRFSYAHEYGHALMDRDRQASVSSGQNAKNLKEQRANAFAAAFLMPAQGVRDFLYGLGKGQGSRRVETAVDSVTETVIRGELRASPRSQHVTYVDVALLGRSFGVSFSATVWRLRGLNIINADQTEVLLAKTDSANRYLRTVRRFGPPERSEHRAPAEGHEDHELEWQILPLALEAWRRARIKRRRLLEIGRLLNIDDQTTLDLAEAVRAG